MLQDFRYGLRHECALSCQSHGEILPALLHAVGRRTVGIEPTRHASALVTQNQPLLGARALDFVLGSAQVLAHHRRVRQQQCGRRPRRLGPVHGHDHRDQCFFSHPPRQQSQVHRVLRVAGEADQRPRAREGVVGAVTLGADGGGRAGVRAGNGVDHQRYPPCRSPRNCLVALRQPRFAEQHRGPAATQGPPFRRGEGALSRRPQSSRGLHVRRRCSLPLAP